MVRYCWRASALGRCDLRADHGANLDGDRQHWIYNIVRSCCPENDGSLADLAQNVQANVDQINFALDCLDGDFDHVVAGSSQEV